MSPGDSTDFANLCTALENVDSSAAFSVLDPASGTYLEHRQLRRDPCYKATWDTSYANELGRLCQGVGVGDTPSGQRVAGTDTFFLINYADIPAHKRKEICQTLIICKVRPEKDDPDHTQSLSGAALYAIQVT